MQETANSKLHFTLLFFLTLLLQFPTTTNNQIYLNNDLSLAINSFFSLSFFWFFLVFLSWIALLLMFKFSLYVFTIFIAAKSNKQIVRKKNMKFYNKKERFQQQPFIQFLISFKKDDREYYLRMYVT